jgi:plasmid maintenance system antidote protein VapI
MIKKSHGEILKEILKQKGIKVPELARSIDVPASSIYAILNREGTGTRKKLLGKISSVLDIPMEVWNGRSEAIVKHRSQKVTVFSDEFYTILSAKNISMENICFVLNMFGYSYTPESLKVIIDNQVEVPYAVVVLIKDMVFSNSALDFADYEFAKKVNSLSAHRKDIIFEMTNELCRLESCQKVIYGE